MSRLNQCVIRRTLLNFTLIAMYGAALGSSAIAQKNAEDELSARKQTLRQGKNFIQTRSYSLEQDQQILSKFKDLRVADVSDGMDRAGLKNTGLVAADIGPLWRDFERYTHRIIGVAVTVRYVPTNRPAVVNESDDQHKSWVGDWYQRLSPEPFKELIRPGTVLVIDDAENSDVGSIGSNNILDWKQRGCVGVVTDATARDTDEIATQRVPLYFRKPGRGIRPGRNLVESVNRPIVVGGVTVMPGDVIVADGDGVVVVPRVHAEVVAEFARAELESDKAGRRRLYKALGIPEDESIK